MYFILKTVTFLAYTLNTLIFLRVVLSWLGNCEQNAATRFIHEATEPILSPIRKALPKIAFIDFSPMIALLIIDVAKTLILNLL